MLEVNHSSLSSRSHTYIDRTNASILSDYSFAFDSAARLLVIPSFETYILVSFCAVADRNRDEFNPRLQLASHQTAIIRLEARVYQLEQRLAAQSAYHAAAVEQELVPPRRSKKGSQLVPVPVPPYREWTGEEVRGGLCYGVVALLPFVVIAFTYRMHQIKYPIYRAGPEGLAPAASAAASSCQFAAGGVAPDKMWLILLWEVVLLILYRQSHPTFRFVLFIVVDIASTYSFETFVREDELHNSNWTVLLIAAVEITFLCAFVGAPRHLKFVSGLFVQVVLVITTYKLWEAIMISGVVCSGYGRGAPGGIRYVNAYFRPDLLRK